ncbi:hypothetical protein BH24ACT12_BH24ACT12_28760 [soil metagenome]
MKALHGANLTLMFLLEMGVYAGVVAWAVGGHIRTPPCSRGPV